MLSPSAKQPIVKLGIYRSSSIGDVVLASSCLNLLSQLPVHFEITWIGRPPAMTLISSAYPNIRTLDVNPEVDRYQHALVEELSSIHFLVDLQASLRSRSICRLLKKVHNIPYFTCEKRYFERGRMVMQSHLRGRRHSLPESQSLVSHFQYLNMMDTLKVALKKHLPDDLHEQVDHIVAPPHLPFEHDVGDRPWQKELKFGHWLAIAPGASYPAKRAPRGVFIDILASFRELLFKNFSDEKNIGLVMIGDELDREETVSIIDRLDWNGPVLNLAGKLSLWESALALRYAFAVISNDSSVAHMAEAVGTPAAVLFGPTIEAFGFAPWRNESRAFSAPLGCRPCSKHGKAECRFGDMLCFNLISVDLVAGHLVENLQQA